MAGLAVLALGAAIWISADNDEPLINAESGSLMLPEFRAMVADATKITLQSGSDSVTLLKADGLKAGKDWHVAERDNYLADARMVNEILLGLARAELQEPKTGDPERLPRVGLGEAATALKVYGPDDAQLLVLRVGNSTMRGAERDLWTFVQREADSHSWLVSGLPKLDLDPATYLDKTIAKISKARVKGVEVDRRAGGQKTDSYMLSRIDPMAEFTVEQIGEGENLFAPAVAAATAAVLDGLRLDDVAPRAEAPDDAEGLVATMRYSMWDGLGVQLLLYEDAEGERWATLDASFDASAATAIDGPRVMPDAPADGATEVTQLNAQWSRWRYKIQTELGNSDLARPRSDFVRSEIPVE